MHMVCVIIRPKLLGIKIFTSGLCQFEDKEQIFQNVKHIFFLGVNVCKWIEIVILYSEAHT